MAVEMNDFDAVLSNGAAMAAARQLLSRNHSLQGGRTGSKPLQLQVSTSAPRAHDGYVLAPRTRLGFVCRCATAYEQLTAADQRLVRARENGEEEEIACMRERLEESAPVAQRALAHVYQASGINIVLSARVAGQSAYLGVYYTAKNLSIVIEQPVASQN
jgi:hypothetical protein